MESKNIVVSVPLEQYRKGIMAIAKLEAFAAYLNYEKYSINREMVAAILDLPVQQEAQ